MNNLISKVVTWAYARNIIAGSTPLKQVEKTGEEVQELVRGLTKLSYLREIHDMLPAGPDDALMESARAEVQDALGDVLVTLIIIAEQVDMDIEDCLASAWEEIKDRKGRMVNGKFVKEESL